MLTHGRDSVDVGPDIYEQQYQQRILKNLHRRARDLGYTLVKRNGMLPNRTQPGNVKLLRRYLG